MPIYEYRCQSCGHTFEELILRRSDEAEVACPRCQKRDVSKEMSAPAAVGGGCGPSPGGGGFS